MVSGKLAEIFDRESKRQAKTINLVASENSVSDAVIQAAATLLTNKYAEGYPGKRYYAGCQHVDEVERYAIELAKKLFNAEHVNVQPHSGSNANLAVYFATLKPGDTILGMDLKSGGHLTHGYQRNISGSYFNAISYDVDPTTGLLDYQAIEDLALKHKPKLIVAGASAYPRTIDFSRFRTIADKVGAYLLADIAHIAGLVATGLHPSPIPYADFVTSTTHKTLRGPRGGLIMCKAIYAQMIDKAVMPGTQGGPLMHIIAAKAAAFEEALDQSFIDYQKQVIKNAQAMADEFIKLGYNITTNGTDNHLFIVDFSKTHPELAGSVVESLLENNHILVNRNLVPNDQKSPLKTSGIRIGTPTITTNGYNEAHARTIVNTIHKIIQERAIHELHLDMETMKAASTAL